MSKQNIQYWRVTDIESTNPALSNNGGDYFFGRIIVTSSGVPVAVRHWTSAEFDYCPLCGSFRNPLNDEHFERWHHRLDRADKKDGEGWASGEDVTDRWSKNAWQDETKFVKIR